MLHGLSDPDVERGVAHVEVSCFQLSLNACTYNSYADPDHERLGDINYGRRVKCSYTSAHPGSHRF